MTCPRVRRHCLEYLSGAQWEKLKFGHKCSPILEKGASPLPSGIKGRLFRSSQTPTGPPRSGETCPLPRSGTMLCASAACRHSVALTAHEAGPECGACGGLPPGHRGCQRPRASGPGGLVHVGQEGCCFQQSLPRGKSREGTTSATLTWGTVSVLPSCDPRSSVAYIHVNE